MLKLCSHITKTPSDSTNNHNPCNSSLNHSPPLGSLSKSARYIGSKPYYNNPTGSQFNSNYFNSPRLSTRSLLSNNHRSFSDSLLYNSSMLSTNSLLCNNRQRLRNLEVYLHTS
jgi:hypothetical protein